MGSTTRVWGRFSPRPLLHRLPVLILDAGYLPWESYDEPRGEQGITGPDSPAWRVLGHEPAALLGGVVGLMVGTLHPVVLHGTLEHTTLREDPLARLARTAGFVRATTYSATPVAERVIDTVNRMHIPVAGTVNGRDYHAADPDLITWVHVTIWGGFLTGYQELSGRPLSTDEVDRYWSDIAPIGEKLGGTSVPRTGADIDRYWADIRGDLAEHDADRKAARAEAQWIMHEVGSWHGSVARDGSHRVGNLFARWGRPCTTIIAALARPPIWFCANILLSALLGMLPTWAAAELGIPRPNRFLHRWRTLTVKLVFFAFDRAAGAPEHVLRARRRCQSPPTDTKLSDAA
ncbi:oxygenase MpaB family protein [Nocardia sp. NPDC052566]|uniref:oxygenase MpaB family protein n=1 Tax=Nocardia sp. NPDC052566 TaxID=3364330 RepID=UPI0037CAD842